MLSEQDIQEHLDCLPDGTIFRELRSAGRSDDIYSFVGEPKISHLSIYFLIYQNCPDYLD